MLTSFVKVLLISKKKKDLVIWLWITVNALAVAFYFILQEIP